MSTLTVKAGADGKIGTGDDEFYVNGKYVGAGLNDEEVMMELDIADSEIQAQEMAKKKAAQPQNNTCNKA